MLLEFSQLWLTPFKKIISLSIKRDIKKGENKGNNQTSLVDEVCFFSLFTLHLSIKNNLEATNKIHIFQLNYKK